MTYATLVSKGTHGHTRKAISPKIATIILIVIIVAIGGLFYAYDSGMFGSTRTSDNVAIQTTLTIPPGANYATWTFSVNNTGTVAITGITAVLYNSTNSPIAVIYSGSHPLLNVPSGLPSGKFTSSTVSPGHTVSGSVLNIPSSSVGAGYNNFQLVVQFANGVQKTYTGAV